MKGLVRATLATIETRVWKVAGITLPGADVVALYMQIPNRIAMARAVDDAPGGRRWDRALSILKNAGLVTFKGGRWERTHDA